MRDVNDLKHIEQLIECLANRNPNTLRWVELMAEGLILRWASAIISNECENPYRPSVCDTGDINLPLSIRVNTLAEKLVSNLGGGE